MILKNKVKRIKGREILTSRGFPTVEVDFVTEYSIIRSSVPSGASKGSKEAITIEDEDSRYSGHSVQGRVKKIAELEDKILSFEAADQASFDKQLLELDGTPNKSNLGANLILPISLNFCRLLSFLDDTPLWKHISRVVNRTPKMPIPYFNVLNGGVHSGNDLKCQEIMLGFKEKTFAKNVEMACIFYQELKKIIKNKYGSIFQSVGDEGGFAPPIKSIEEGIELLIETSKSCNISDFSIALDCAANEFHKDGKYDLGHGSLNGIELAEYYLDIANKFKMLCSIEDPFSEDDIESWKYFFGKKPENLSIVADDLTVTNSKIIAKLSGMFTAVLIKPNQIGTVSGALSAVMESYEHGCATMVSHRSAETEDTFICSLAVGVGANYIKCGAPCRGERVSKYNKLLRIEEEINENY